MNTHSDLERKLRLSIHAPKMLDALKSAEPMLRWLCSELEPVVAMPEPPEDLRNVYDAALVALFDVQAALDAAEPTKAKEEPSNLVMMRRAR